MRSQRMHLSVGRIAGSTRLSQTGSSGELWCMKAEDSMFGHAAELAQHVTAALAAVHNPMNGHAAGAALHLRLQCHAPASGHHCIDRHVVSIVAARCSSCGLHSR